MIILLLIWNLILTIKVLGIDKKFSYHVSTTFLNNTKLGVWIYFNKKGLFYIPFRNSKKTNHDEEIGQMMQMNSQAKRQSLGAKFSWLKTQEKVDQFEKDYSVVDREYVEELVRQFRAKFYNS